MTYWVYIMPNCTRSAFYVGVTSDLSRRVWEHQNHIDADSFTSRYNVCDLLFFEGYDNPADAIGREKQIKGWSRSKKLKLIAAFNPSLKTLTAVSG